MNFIKELADGKNGKVEENIHIQFQKFSRGEFRNKAAIRAKYSAKKWTINTTPEYANDMIREVAKKLGDKKTKVVGAIVSTSDLTGDVDFKEKKQFQGVKRYLIETEMSGKEILNLMAKIPKAFFGLSFKSDDSEVKIKPKAPTSGKPGKGDEAPKTDFCKLITSDEKLGKSYVFEKPDFKEAEIVHNFFIKEIIPPKGEKDFAVIREKATRKGIIERVAKIDEKVFSKKIDFEA